MENNGCSKIQLKNFIPSEPLNEFIKLTTHYNPSENSEAKGNKNMNLEIAHAMLFMPPRSSVFGRHMFYIHNHAPAAALKI